MSKPLVPFESIWLIFLKLQFLNRSSPSDIFGACLSADQIRPVLWSRSWLEEQNLQELTGLAIESLDSAFTPKGSEGYTCDVVKHCPECLKMRYHCSVFQLNIIEECPWHGVRLEFCRECTSIVQTHGLFRSTTPRGGIEFSCGHFKIMSGEVLLTSVPIDLSERIESFCSNVKRWLESAAEVSRFLLPYVHGKKGEQESVIGVRDVALSYLEDKVVGAPWLLEYLKFPVKIINIGGEKFTGRSVSDVDLRACLKSLRRNVRKRYLRRHASCYRVISQYQVTESRTIILDQTCPAAMALLIWDVKCRILDINVVPWKFGALAVVEAERSYEIGYVLNVMLARFFDIWGRLELHSHHCTDESLVVDISELLCKGFGLCFDCHNDSGAVVYVDPDFLKKRRNACLAVKRGCPTVLRYVYDYSWVPGMSTFVRLFSMTAARTKHVHFYV
ncbi:hypothetical protein [Ectopseudomonas oleovorans]|uniref:hypothetical protein n=1 Tax=Ectopseudomonas oleovorans TaxID=301 RepID=UPI0011B1D546|nr:hypothetical protein [Pseudomonas indoloxydans]